MSEAGQQPSLPFKSTYTIQACIIHFPTRKKKPMTIKDNAFNQMIVLLPLGRRDYF
jgi:hypothetical protein